MSETLSLATVKARFSELVDRVAREQDRVTVTRRGKPAAVLVSPDDLESLEETLAVLSDPRLLDQIRDSKDELESGEHGISLDDVRAELADRRRRA
ncbi:MAG: type II toxin-antitoxin system Phd/YefM family antitoxin [Thermoleophilaceae bacterium]